MSRTYTPKQREQNINLATKWDDAKLTPAAICKKFQEKGITKASGKPVDIIWTYNLLSKARKGTQRPTAKAKSQTKTKTIVRRATRK